MANYEVLEPGGHAALVDGLKDYADREGGTDTEQLADGSVEMNKLGDDVLDELDSKAYADGYYAQMTVGSADNLTARGDAVEAEFLYRTSGGIADIESGNATIKSIKGNTVRWNQLCDREWTGSTKARVTTTNSDGTMTVTTNSATSLKFVDFVVTAGHTYLIKGDYTTSGEAVAYGTYDANNNYDKRVYLSGEVSTVQHVADLLTTTSTYNRVRVVNFGTTVASGASCTVKNLMLIDLTLLYGAGNEPETAAEFEALYSEPYYPYDAGSLKPVQLAGIETTGFNAYDPSTSTAKLLGGNAYQITGTYTALSYSTGESIALDSDGQFTVSENGILTVTGGNSTDTCVHLVWSGRRNGEYEPYWKAERLIALSTHFPTGLKKAGTVYDELTATEAIVRVGEVDLGTLTWVYGTSTENPFFRTVGPSDMLGATTAGQRYIECAEFDVGNSTTSGAFGSNAPDRRMCQIYSQNYKLAVRDDSYTDAAAFKAAMSGVTLYYALATPTTTAIDPALNLTYKVDDWGTERVMVPDGTVSAVPTFDIIYGMNAVDTIRRLPDLYAGKAETEAALDTKANIDGYYQQLTAGAADNLTGRGDATAGEYLFRTTAGTASVSDEGVATVKSIHGRTVRWNQLLSVSMRSPQTENDLTATVSDSVITINGTASAKTQLYPMGPSAIFHVTSGHKYLIKGCPAGGSSETYGLGFGDGKQDTGSGSIMTLTLNTTVRIVIESGTVCNNLVFKPQVFDLTAMFGAGNEPSTVAEFEALYPLPYYEYDAGTLLPVRMTGIETNGFNQWDEEWETGRVDPSTGRNTSSTANIRSKNLIPVFPSTNYVLTNTRINTAWDVVAYDANGTYIKYLKWGGSQLKSTALTTPDNCHYLRFSTNAVNGGGGYGGTYQNDICLNLVWSGYRNGEYEPYWSNQRLIPAGTLRAAGTAYDEQTETERTIRIAEIDLGTLTWTESGSTAGSFTSSTISDIKTVNNAVVGNLTCAKYDTYSGNAVDSNTGISNGLNGAKTVRVHDATYAGDAAAFKTAMDGVILYYEVAEPTVTTYDPPLNLDYRYADFGTERIMVPDGEMSAPPIIEAVYGINATDTIRNLPTDYISHASMSQFRLALMAHLGIFINETWDEVDNRYEYTITSE